MTFQVVVTRRAKDDLRHYFAVAAEHAPATAARWLKRFEQALQTLSTDPMRCPLAPENDLVDKPVYQFFYGKGPARYRALFTMEGRRVLVLHVRFCTLTRRSDLKR